MQFQTRTWASLRTYSRTALMFANHHILFPVRVVLNAAMGHCRIRKFKARQLATQNERSNLREFFATEF